VRIEAEAFYESGLTNLVIPSLIESLGERCFSCCESLLSNTFESKSKFVRLEAEAFCWSGLTNVVIPSSIESHGEGCFYWCESLLSITFESRSKLARLEAEAFCGSGLISIVGIRTPFGIESHRSTCIQGICDFTKASIEEILIYLTRPT
jgi:hypothetical protein